MPTRSPLLLGALFLFLLPGSPLAEPISGRTVWTWLEDSKTADSRSHDPASVAAGRWHGYLAGLADAMAVTRAYCPPPNLPHKNHARALEKFLEHYFPGRDQPAAPRIMTMLRQAYPCASPPKRRAEPAGERKT
jgi:hypothetical protein